MQPSFEIRLLAWNEAMPLARAVREQVFIVEQNVPRGLEWDEWDARSDHAVALESNGLCIGTARLLPDGRLGRMAVLREWRRRGAGAALARALIARARALGMRRLVLHAQTHAAPFYRGLGFAEQGPIFEEAGIPHVRMEMELKATAGP
jgi:predicted GNAT family N-acyltransferase